MRILSITAQKPHSTGSGVYLTGLVKGFAALGHEQAVVAGIYEEDEVYFPEGTRFYPVYYKTEGLPFPIAGMSDEMPYESTIYSRMTGEMVGAFKKAFTGTIREAVDSFRPDLILCHHLYLLTAVVRETFPQCRVAAICHGTGLRQVKKNGLERDYIIEQIRKLDVVFSLHQEQKKEIERVYGVREECVKVIGSGYDDSVFRRIPHRETYTDRRLIYAGKLSGKKGVMSLLRCLRYLKEEPDQLEIWLAGGYGNHQEYEEIRRLAEEAPYPVVFLGRLEQTQLAERMNQAHVFVLPSFYEGLPLVVIEALACGLQVVCSDLPGVKPWLDSNIGNCPVDFVKLPAILNADEPVEEELPAFEKRLAEAIGRRLAMAGGEGMGGDGAAGERGCGDGAAGEGIYGDEAAGEGMAGHSVDLSHISWTGISRKILWDCCP